MPAKKTPIRLGLYVSEKRDRDYYHATAYPVIIGPTRWEMQYAEQTGEPHNVPRDRIRGCSGGDAQPLYLDGLYVYSQGGNDDAPRRLYAWQVEYRDVFSIDARKADAMHKTLTTIARRMEKTANTYGQPSTFGAYVARVADAIGADAIVFPPPRPASSYDDREHRIETIAHGVYCIDRMIETWTAAGQPAKENA
jgi:hypothetical protein